MNCPKCGSDSPRLHNANYPEKALYLCLNLECGHYFTQWQQTLISELQAKVRELQGEWRTGKPPVDGYYWIKYTSNDTPDMEWFALEVDWVRVEHSKTFYWSGPLLPPSEKEE